MPAGIMTRELTATDCFRIYCECNKAIRGLALYTCNENRFKFTNHIRFRRITKSREFWKYSNT